MKKILTLCMKAGAAMLIAFLILNVCARFYYYTPWNIESVDGSTDFVFPSGFSGMNLTEGMTEIKLDSNGYNNKEIPDEIHALCMGSSHTLGYCVRPDESWPSVLERICKTENPEFSIYNIGIYSHVLLSCLNNLENALETFQPKEYVVIETQRLDFDTEKLTLFNAGEYPEIPEITGKMMRLIKRFPYFQLALHQLNNMLSGSGQANAAAATGDNAGEGITEVDTSIPEEFVLELEQVMEKAGDIAEEHGCKLIIFYHPAIYVDEDGNPQATGNPEYSECYKSACEKAGVVFLDVTEAFKNAYNKDHVFPRGFTNTTLGEGHLNRYGHKIIGAEVARLITGKDAE